MPTLVLRTSSLASVFTRTVKTSALSLALLTLFFITLFFGVQNFSKASIALSLDLPFTQEIGLFFSTYFDVRNTFAPDIFIMLVLISFLEAMTFILFYVYMKARREALHAEKASVLVSTLLTLFGTSCAACGGAVLSVLSSLGVVGSGIALRLLDSEVLLSVVLVFLLVTVYRLLKKVANPLVC